MLEGILKLLCNQWFRRLTSGHNYVFLRLLLRLGTLVLFVKAFLLVFGVVSLYGAIYNDSQLRFLFARDLLHY